MPTNTPMIYEGSEPYIFVSHPSYISESTSLLLSALSCCGYRLWYDNGILTGLERACVVEERIDSAEVFLAVLSCGTSVCTEFWDELWYAHRNGKNLLLVCPDEEEPCLPRGFGLLLGRCRRISRMQYPDEDKFLAALCSSPLLADCRAPSAEETVELSLRTYPHDSSILLTSPERCLRYSCSPEDLEACSRFFEKILSSPGTPGLSFDDLLPPTADRPLVYLELPLSPDDPEGIPETSAGRLEELADSNLVLLSFEYTSPDDAALEKAETVMCTVSDHIREDALCLFGMQADTAVPSVLRIVGVP